MAWMKNGLIVCLFLLFVAGCQSGTNGRPNSEEEVKKAVERKQQSLWFVINEDGSRIRNLDDEDPIVREVREVVSLHADIVDNRSYKNPDIAGEFATYTDGFVNQLTKEKYEQSLLDMYRDNGIEIRQVQIAWYQMAFHEDLRTVRVKTESELVIEQCSQAYLDRYELKTGQNYSQLRIVDLVKEGDTWKIAKIEKGPFISKQKSNL